MLSETKRNRPRPLRRIRRRTSYPLPFGLDGMAGAGRPARLRARPRPLFLVCPPADGPLCARRLGGLPPAGLAPPRPENRLQGSALSRPVRLGLGLRGLRPSAALLGAGGAVPPRLHGLCPSGLLLSARQHFRPVHATHPGSALRLPEGRRGKRLFPVLCLVRGHVPGRPAAAHALLFGLPPAEKAVDNGEKCDRIIQLSQETR